MIIFISLTGVCPDVVEGGTPRWSCDRICPIIGTPASLLPQTTHKTGKTLFCGTKLFSQVFFLHEFLRNNDLGYFHSANFSSTTLNFHLASSTFFSSFIPLDLVSKIQSFNISWNGLCPLFGNCPSSKMKQCSSVSVPLTSKKSFLG